MKRFVLGSELIRDNAISEVLSVPLDWSYEVIIRKAKSKRSNAQNNLMWGVWEPIFADYVGFPYTTEKEKKHFHDNMLMWMYGYDEVQKEDYKGNIYFEREPKKRTRDMSVKEMAEHLTAMEMMAVEQGLTLPYPDDYKYALTGKR
jgi:hypothetical protein